MHSNVQSLAKTKFCADFSCNLATVWRFTKCSTVLLCQACEEVRRVPLKSLNQKKRKTRHHVKLTCQWAINQPYSLWKAPHARTYLSNTMQSHIWYVSTPSLFQVFQRYTSQLPSILGQLLGWSKGNLEGSCGGEDADAVIEKRTRYGEVVILKC